MHRRADPHGVLLPAHRRPPSSPPRRDDGAPPRDLTIRLEAPEEGSGAAEGRLVSRLIDGSSPSYQVLLGAASDTDSLRVVDGEIDNRFDPKKTSLRLVR